MRNNRAGAVAIFIVTSYEKYHAQIAGREKNREFTRESARHGMTDRKTLLKRLAVTKLDPAVSKLVRGGIERDFPRARKR